MDTYILHAVTVLCVMYVLYLHVVIILSSLIRRAITDASENSADFEEPDSDNAAG